MQKVTNSSDLAMKKVRSGNANLGTTTEVVLESEYKSGQHGQPE